MKVFFFVLVNCFSVWAFAQSSSVSSSSAGPAGESRASQSDLIQNRKFEESKEITDAKLKAEAGSLSKYSLKFNLSYFGPTLGDLSAKDQPNPDGTVGTYETALTGDMGLRYRFNSNASLSAGTGLRAVHPMHGMERFDVQTPYVSYDRTARIAGIQIRHSPGISLTTIPNYKDVGQVGSISYAFSSIYDLGESRFALGVDAVASVFVYNRDYRPSDKRASRGALMVYPALKYNQSDKLSFITSTSFAWLSPRSYSNESVLLNRTVTQRLGLGYAYSRDVYFFPYLSMYPSKLSLDSTTVSLSTTFSLL